MIDGATIFDLHDCHGVPFDFILEELKDNQLSFSVKDWMKKAHLSGWTYEKIMKFLLNPYQEQEDLCLKHHLTQTYLLVAEE